MSTHELKVWPEEFWKLWRGEKTFEWRRDDRGYQEGDLLTLRLYDPATGCYIGDTVTRRVTYIMRSGFGLPDGYVIMAIATP